MSDYNDALIRALLGIALIWIFVSALFNYRIDSLKKDFDEIARNYRQEIDRLKAELEIRK